MTSIGVTSGQEVEVLFRWSKSNVAFGIVDFINPKFLPFIILIVDLEKDLVYDAFREELLIWARFPSMKGIRNGGKVPVLIIWCVRSVGRSISWCRSRGRRSSPRQDRSERQSRIWAAISSPWMRRACCCSY